MIAEKEEWLTACYSSEGRALNLSKARLGDFMYHLIRLGGQPRSAFCLGTQMNRSYIQMRISLSKGKREELEKATGIKLELLPTIVLNGKPQGDCFI